VPFGDYGGSSDSVVARLEFSMPTDAETKLADIGRAVESVKTSWEATNRFTKEFMDYMKELPDIEKKIKDLHAAQTEGLKASTEALGEASEASEKLVSTPITGIRTAGSGSGQPHIPTVEPPPVARSAHEHLTDADLTKPDAHRTTVGDSSAPPAAYPHDTSSAPPAPAQHEHPDSARPAPAYHHQHPGSDQPAPHTSFYDMPASPAPARPHTSLTPPPQHQPQAAPIVSHTPVVHVPTVQEASDHKNKTNDFRTETERAYSSSTPAPVSRPPVPIPTAEQHSAPPHRPPVPVPPTGELPSPQQPILPVQTEFGTSVPPPPLASSQVAANVLGPTATPSPGSRPDAQYPDIPGAERATPARTQPESARDDRETLLRPNTFATPSLPGEALTQTNTPPAPPTSSTHPIWSARPPHGRSDAHLSSSRDGTSHVSAEHAQQLDSSRPAPAHPHTVSPETTRTGPGIASPGARPPAHHETSSMGAPPPAPGHERIQTHEAAQTTQPTPSAGGSPPRIESSQGGPASRSAENVVIRAGSVKIETDAPTQVHSPQSHVQAEQSHVQTGQPPVVRSPSLSSTARSPIVPLTESSAQDYRQHGTPAPAPAQAPSVAPTTVPTSRTSPQQHEQPTETRIQDLRPPQHQQPQVDQQGVEGAPRVIGHIRPPTQPTTTTTTPTQGQGQASPPRATGQSQPTSSADYRQKLGGQLKGNPSEIYDRLHQRGMTSETTGDNGEKQYKIHLGNRTVSADQFMNDESLQDEALDALGQQSGPQSPENGGPLKRAMHAGGLLKGIGKTAMSGGNAEGAVGELGEMVSSMGKAGGAAAGLGGVIGGAARFAGPVGMGIAAATGANALVQSGGQKVQDLYNEGTIRGGGTMEGAKMEAGVAAMALNPFISNEQSRQVIMGALNSGAQGPAYDSVTAFMKDNLTNLNVSVADSAKMLNTNVKDGGQSIESLSLQLGNLKEQAKTGGQTFDQLKQNFQQRSGELITQGAPGGAAGRQATEEGLVFNQNLPSGAKNPLSGDFSGLSSQMAQSDVVTSQQGAKYGPPGMDPMAVPSYLAETGQGVEANADQLGQWIKMAKNGPEMNWPSNLVRIAAAQHVTITYDKAKEYMKQYGDHPESAGRDIAKGARDQANQSAHNTTEHKGLLGMGNAGDMVSAMGSQFSKGWDSLFGSDQDVEQDNANIAAREGAYANPALDRVTSEFGLGNTVVYDPEGKPQKVDYNNQEQMEGLQSGDYTIAGAATDEQREGLAGDDWEGQANKMKPGSQSLTDAVVSNTGDSEGGGGSGGQFGLTPEAAQLLKLIPGASTNNSPNTEDSNAGVGGATMNNPAPGNSGSPAAFPTG